MELSRSYELIKENEFLQNKIQELLRVEGSLRFNNNMLQLLLGSVQKFAMFLVTPGGNIQSWNEGAQTLFGYEYNEILGRNLSLLYRNGENRKNKIPPELVIAANEGRYKKEVWRRRKNGSIFKVKTTISRLLDGDENIMGYGIVERYVTRKKLAESSLERTFGGEHKKNALQENILAIALHELINPLTAVTLTVNLLSEDEEKNQSIKHRNAINDIKESLFSMTQLINNMLLRSKMGTDHINLRYAPINMVEFCRKTVKKAKLSYDFNDRIIFDTVMDSCSFYGDEAAINYILTNLLSNAVKYSPRDKPVYLTLQISENYLSIEVRDRGIGIPHEEQEIIFEPFRRGINVGDTSGSGLGLSIVKYFCQLHGATIRLTSAPGDGSTFLVSFPYNKNTEDIVDKFFSAIDVN